MAGPGYMVYKDLPTSPLILLIPVLSNIEKGMVQRIVRIDCVRIYNGIIVKVSALTSEMGLQPHFGMVNVASMPLKGSSRTYPQEPSQTTVADEYMLGM